MNLYRISSVPVNGRVFDESEILNLDSSLIWLTDGRFSEEFSAKLSKFLDIKHARIVNSGSSANLLLILINLKKIKNKIEEGSEVILPLLVFQRPSTIFQNNLTPAMDSEIGTYNPLLSL